MAIEIIKNNINLSDNITESDINNARGTNDLVKHLNRHLFEEVHAKIEINP